MYILLYISLLIGMGHASWLNQGSIDPSERLIEAVESLLQKRYPEKERNLKVRIERTGGSITKDGPFEIVFPESYEVPRALVRIEVNSQAEDLSGWALIYVAHYDSVLTVNRSVKNDEMVTPQDLSTVWAEVTRFQGEPLTPDAAREMFAHGEVFASRHISADRFLKHQDLRNAYDISTGQAVTMYYQRNGIHLSLTCKARNQGFTGEHIKLFSPDTQLMYKAQITGPGLANWVETLQ